MTIEDLLYQLETLGTAQNRKIYGRHGISEPMFGVSYGNLEKLRKQIKKNHPLALQLWDSGNHDARVLATKIADPKQMTMDVAEAWTAEITNAPLADGVSDLLFKSPILQACIDAWKGTDEEYRGRIAWHLIAQQTRKKSYADEQFTAYLPEIEARIQQMPDRLKEGMHNCLLSIGLRNDVLAEVAIASAERIGEIVIDHGETNCKTPVADVYIRGGREKLRKRGK